MSTYRQHLLSSFLPQGNSLPPSSPPAGAPARLPLRGAAEEFGGLWGEQTPVRAVPRVSEGRKKQKGKEFFNDHCSKLFFKSMISVKHHYLLGLKGGVEHSEVSRCTQAAPPVFVYFSREEKYLQTRKKKTKPVQFRGGSGCQWVRGRPQRCWREEITPGNRSVLF